MKAHFPFWIIVSLLLISGGALSEPSTDILATDDLSSAAAEARRFGTPILVLFSDEHCGYCERLKKEVLGPLEQRGELRSFERIRELEINRGGKIRDFDGEKIRTKIFVERYGIYATPTLMLVDHHGKPIGTPIGGFNNGEDYIPYLEYFMDVAYWEPQQLELPCEKQLAASVLDQDYLKNGVTAIQHGDLQSVSPAGFQVSR